MFPNLQIRETKFNFRNLEISSNFSKFWGFGVPDLSHFLSKEASWTNIQELEA